MGKALTALGEVFVSAPAIEQSGVSHGLTYLKPLHPVSIDTGNNFGLTMSGFTVDGTPSDCVRLAVSKLMDSPPDIIVSGINKGLNAGINVLYSGTVAGAREGSMFGITSFAISLEQASNPDFEKAAKIAVELIEDLASKDLPKTLVYNINIPTAALDGERIVKVVPMETNRYGHEFETGIDPRGCNYFWTSIDPPPERNNVETDTMALEKGFITLSPLTFDLTHSVTMKFLKSQFEVESPSGN